jgi:16S rRNA (guanine1207-N2)-methyltransferase
MIEASVCGFDLRLETDPRLFAPRAVDAGTLAMLSCVRFEPGDKVLDLGCGYGVVGVVAAKTIGADNVWLLDKDPLAVEIATRNLAANGVAGAHVAVSDGFRDFRETGFTKIVSNPPYHTDFSTPKHFIEKGFNRLAIGGRMFVVTKRDTWYRNKLKSIFGGSRVHTVGGYFVFEAEKRSASYAR